MAVDYATMNDALLDTFGESVTFTRTNLSQVIASAAFRGPWEGYSVAGIPVERPVPMLEMKTADWEGLGVVAGNTVLVRGVTYTLTEITADEAGMSRLLLEAYRP